MSGALRRSPRIAGDIKLWDARQKQILRQLWCETPQLSCSEIGRRMGLSKNSIVGQAHRLNLPVRPSPIREAGSGDRPRSAMRRENVSLPPMAELKQPMVQPVARPIVLQPVALLPVSAVVAVNLGCECRWPFGDPKDRANFRFCGALAPLGQSYCTEHRAVAYVTVAKRQMEAA